MEDQDLLNKLKARDRSAFVYLYDNCYRVVEHYVRKNMGDTAEAKDIFQDAVLILVNKIDTEKVHFEKSVVAYLIGITRYLVLRKRSKNQPKIVPVQSLDHLNDSEELELLIRDQEQYALFHKHFSRLGSDCKKILQFFFDKKSMAEIAELMKLSSLAYAKKKKFICQKRLIESIKNDPLYNELTN